MKRIPSGTIPGGTCSQIVTLIHNFSQLFTTVHNATMVSPCEELCMCLPGGHGEKKMFFVGEAFKRWHLHFRNPSGQWWGQFAEMDKFSFLVNFHTVHSTQSGVGIMLPGYPEYLGTRK